MLKSETSWLDNEIECDDCTNLVPMGYICVDYDGENVCKGCAEQRDVEDQKVNLKVGDLVIEKRLHNHPFPAQLSLVTEIIEQAQRKVMVQNILTGGEYWLYLYDVREIKWKIK
jgi:hypothetical protein